MATHKRKVRVQYRKLRLLFYFGVGVFSGVSALVYTYFLAQLALQGGGGLACAGARSPPPRPLQRSQAAQWPVKIHLN